MIRRYHHQKKNELFSNFRKKICRYAQHLDCQSSIKDLLLSDWCRVHNAAHSEVTCSLCRVALNQVCKRHSEVLDAHTLSQEDTASPEIPEKRAPKQEKNEMMSPEIPTGTVINPNQTWTLRFDGSKSKRGAGAGIELISPTSETYLAAYRLQFHCTNNIAEYESLVHGLLLAIKKGAQILHCFGDSDVVVRQVRRQYTCHDKRLFIATVCGI